MCGIVGIVGTSAVNQRIYDALTVLQHRGQDAAGIATSVDGELYTRKGSGLVRDVFQQHHMLELKGNYGIGHVRYPTAGCDSASEAQPFYVNAPYGICIEHNGNLTNAADVRQRLERQGSIFQTNSDTEVIVHLIALSKEQTLPDAMADALRRVEGAFSLVMLSSDRIFAARDPRGFRNHRQDLEAAESGGAAHRDTAVEEADLNSDPSIRSGWRELGHLSRWERSGFSRSSEEIRVSGHGETIVCNPHPNLEQDA